MGTALGNSQLWVTPGTLDGVFIFLVGFLKKAVGKGLVGRGFALLPALSHVVGLIGER